MLLKQIFKKGLDKPLFFEEDQRLVDNSTPIGIELELENYDKAVIPDGNLPKYWWITSDGSLRPKTTGREYISGIRILDYTPIYGMYIIEALEEFDNIVKYNEKYFNIVPTISHRCSVHIHLNVGDITLEQLYSLIILYLIFEKVLFTFVDPTGKRWDNNYCVPLTKTKPILDSLKSIVNPAMEDSIWGVVTKYDAVNLHSIVEKGTIEFRMHPGCYDVKRILQWINILFSLKKYIIKNSGKWLEILSTVSGRGTRYFLENVFKDYSELLIYPRVDVDIIDGLRIAEYVEYRDLTSKSINEFKKSISTKECTKLAKTYNNFKVKAE